MISNSIQKGSLTAKNGFLNEDFVRDEFNKWKTSELSQAWLTEMGYSLENIESVWAEKLSGYKTDVQVSIKVMIKLTTLTDIQNLQVKLMSNRTGFNQIDKRWVDKYAEMWNMDTNTITALKHYTGELSPYSKNVRDTRRMFMDELSEQDKASILNFIHQNKLLIVSDIIKGRGEFHAEWMLVVLRTKDEFDWTLKTINFVMNYFGNGEVRITKQGNIKIGNISMQRKGGDNGRATANMLQFKINPAHLFNIQ